ncbi:MAG: glutathione S-transferase family protein [Alphaproteobacteria bacterium]
MLRIWGRGNSSNVQKVVWLCEEIALPYERIDVGGAFGGLDVPDYLARNPNGRIPAIDDDGFVLWESNAIVRYLADKYGAGALWPNEFQQRALCDRWLDWQQTTLAVDFVSIVYALLRTPPEERNPDAIAAATARLSAALTIFDAELEGRDYIMGDQLTIGDIPTGVWIYRWFLFELEGPDLPNVSAWYERLKARAAYRKSVMVKLA